MRKQVAPAISRNLQSIGSRQTRRSTVRALVVLPHAVRRQSTPSAEPSPRQCPTSYTSRYLDNSPSPSTGPQLATCQHHSPSSIYLESAGKNLGRAHRPYHRQCCGGTLRLFGCSTYAIANHLSGRNRSYGPCSWAAAVFTHLMKSSCTTAAKAPSHPSRSRKTVHGSMAKSSMPLYDSKLDSPACWSGIVSIDPYTIPTNTNSRQTNGIPRLLRHSDNSGLRRQQC